MLIYFEKIRRGRYLDDEASLKIFYFANVKIQFCFVSKVCLFNVNVLSFNQFISLLPPDCLSSFYDDLNAIHFLCNSILDYYVLHIMIILFNCT